MGHGDPRQVENRLVVFQHVGTHMQYLLFPFFRSWIHLLLAWPLQQGQ